MEMLILYFFQYQDNRYTKFIHNMEEFICCPRGKYFSTVAIFVSNQGEKHDCKESS